MDDICVSVIVPIYNVEQYLRRCLETLVNQTLQSLELILVNDGTKDNSMEIVREYEKKYSNIVVLDKENGGLSSARNAGLQIARGEYVAFVDSDDYVLPEMMEELYHNAKENNADMVMSGYYRQTKAGKIIEIPLELEKEIYLGQDIVDLLLIPMTGALPKDNRDIEIDMCVWRNMYRKKMILEQEIWFESERKVLSEDIIFHLDLFPKMKIVSTVKKSYYFYVENPGSLTKNTDFSLCQRQYALYNEIKKRLMANGLWERASLRCKRLFWGRIRHMMNRYVYHNRSSYSKCYQYLQKVFKEEIIREIFEGFPINTMPLRSRIIAICMKYHQIWLCYLIFSIHAAE